MHNLRRAILIAGASTLASAAWARSLDAIKQSGKLVAATEGAFTPFNYFDGSKLTGETNSERMGKSTIENGKVDGDNLTFTITIKIQDNELKVDYKGKVTGNTIKLTAETPNGAFEYNVKKVE